MKAIGVDLGTYNTVAAYAPDRQTVHLIRNKHGRTSQGMVFPSFIRFDADGMPSEYGERARLGMEEEPDAVVWGIKRLIGRSYSSLDDANQLSRFAFTVELGPDGGPAIHVGGYLQGGRRFGGQKYTPSDVSARLLKWVKDSAESPFNPFITEPVTRLVVTHPAYFDSLQIEHTKKAATMRQEDGGPGFLTVDTIAEPVAAALAYGIQLDSTKPRFIAAIDWGAGTLDIAIVALTRDSSTGNPILREVRPARGDTALGGIDMDDRLIDAVISRYGLTNVTTLSTMNGGDPINVELWRDYCRLRKTVESLKIQLSRQHSAQEDITVSDRLLKVKIARTRDDRTDGAGDWVIAQDALAPLLSSFMSHVQHALKRSGLAAKDIQHVLLIGGPMHLPFVRDAVKEMFASNKQILEELQRIDIDGFPVSPMEAVARGAALLTTGVIPPPPPIMPRDYGVLLRNQGDILIRDGSLAGREYPYRNPQTGTEGVLSCNGSPGDEIPVGLFKREFGPDNQPLYTRMGHYLFPPTFRNGMASFRPVLLVSEDKVISLRLHDLVSGRPLTLERLSSMDGDQIEPPIAFGEAAAHGGGPAGDTESTVTAERVASYRSRALACSRMAIAKLAHAHVASNPLLRNTIAARLASIDTAIRGIPDVGPADQTRVQALAFAMQELLNTLESNQLLSSQEIRTIL